MTENENGATTAPSAGLFQGCNFDALTQKAVHGKNVVAMLFDKTGTEPLAIAGQQGLSFTLELETSESKTKDGTGWASKFPGIKSWNASTDGLYAFDDPARNTMVKAMVDGEFLCFGIYKKESVAGGTKYTPIRKGIAIPTSDELDAPEDDSMTYSCSFEGSGPCWCIETATPEEVEAMSVTTSDDLLPEPPDDGTEG